MALEVNGVTIETDEEGFLVNLSDWTPKSPWNWRRAKASR